MELDLGSAMKFKIDSAVREKPGPTGIGGVLRNDKGVVLCLFSNGVGIGDSNEAEVLAILEAPRIFSRSLRLIVLSDSYNAISWVNSSASKPWKLHFHY